MLTRRYNVRVADIAQEYLDAYCEKKPDFREIWRLILWRIEAGGADKMMKDHGDGWYTATVVHSLRFPAVTVYFRLPDRQTVHIHHVTFDAVH